MLLQGLETLSLRMDRHLDNASKLADWLASHEHVEWVSFLGHESHPSHQQAARYFRKGAFTPILNFGVKGGKAASEALINSVQLASHLGVLCAVG